MEKIETNFKPDSTSLKTTTKTCFSSLQKRNLVGKTNQNKTISLILLQIWKTTQQYDNFSFSTPAETRLSSGDTRALHWGRLRNTDNGSMNSSEHYTGLWVGGQLWLEDKISVSEQLFCPVLWCPVPNTGRSHYRNSKYWGLARQLSS